jgi:hypothetical protein
MFSTRSKGNLVLAAIILLLFGIISISIAKEGKEAKDEKKFDKRDLPAAVTTAFQKAYPKATIKGADKEMKDSTQYYEIESVEGKTERSILYLPDGTVFEIEEGIDASMLPALVKATINKDYPKGKIEKAEKITRGTTTEFEIKVAVGKEKTEVVLDGSGKVIKTEKAGAKNEKDEEDEDQDKD